MDYILPLSKKSRPGENGRQRRWRELWSRNKSIILMVWAQMLSSLMAVSGKLLQTSNIECGALSTTQVLITMLGITMVFCWIYMGLFKVADAPLGPNGLAMLLNFRGISGVFGIWGFYYSLRYLPLSEATIINFLAPMVAAFTSTLLIGTPFTLVQQISGAISITGVVLVSQPWNIFKDIPPSVRPDIMNRNFTVCPNCTIEVQAGPGISPQDHIDSFERVSAVAAALVGVAGGAAAYVSMAWIGKRAHPVLTVNYFATWTVLLSALSFGFVGLDDIRMPNGYEWALLVFLGVFALGLQLLMTASLQGEGSNRALNMVYTQIVFALIADRVVWGLSPNWVSLVGGSLILGSVVGVALTKDGGKKADEKARDRNEVHEEEEVEMMVRKDDRQSFDDER